MLQTLTAKFLGINLCKKVSPENPWKQKVARPELQNLYSLLGRTPVPVIISLLRM